MLKSSSQGSVSSASSPVETDRNILSAAKGGGIMFAGTMFQYAARFVIGIVLARILGAEQYGLYNLSMSAVAVAGGLALMGFTTALVRYVSLFATRRDTARLWGTLQVGLGLPGIVSVLFGVGLFVLADPIADRLFHEPQLAALLRLGSLAVPFLALQNLASAATRGFKKMEYTVIAQSVSMPVTKLVLMLALAITGLSAAKALSAYMLSVIVGSVMLVYFLNKLFSLGRPVGTAHRETGKMLRFALPLYASDLITTFRGSMQTVLLGALHTVTSVGVFAVVSQVTLVGKMFHSSIAVSSMPIVSELHGRGELKHLERLYQTMTRWTFTLNLPLFLVVLLFPEQILSAFGQDFVGGATALVILAWANLAKTGSGICNALLDMTGRTRLKLMNSAVRSVLLIGLNVLLIPSWGVVGAATAVVVSSVVSSLFALLENFLLLRMLPYNMSFLKPIAAGLAATGVVLALGRVLSPEVSLFHAAVNVFVLLVAYVSVILLLGLTEEDRSVLTRLWGRTGRKVLEYLPSLTALGK